MRVRVRKRRGYYFLGDEKVIGMCRCVCRPRMSPPAEAPNGAYDSRDSRAAVSGGKGPGSSSKPVISQEEARPFH